MDNAGNTVATLLIGAAIGAAVGYIIATDKDKRQNDLDKIKDQVNDWKESLKEKADEYRKKSKDIEEDIYNA